MLYNLILLAANAATKVEPSFWERVWDNICTFGLIVFCIAIFGTFWTAVNSKPTFDGDRPW